MRMPAGATLAELASLLRVFQPELTGDAQLRVVDVDQDSRSIAPGSLFVARAGGKSDGRLYAQDAVRRGAVAVMTDAGAELSGLACPLLKVQDLPRALGFAAEAVHGYPSHALKLAGVTGTNGKTTVSWLIQRLLDELGMPCGRLGTLGVEFAGRKEESHLTTQEADAISRSLAAMVRHGATHAAMEVSSAALSLCRVDALRFDVAAFSNLTHDHLDFHGTFEAYRQAKLRLFHDLSPRVAVLNVDDAFGEWLASHPGGEVIRVGTRGAADISGADLTAGPRGIEGTLHAHGADIPLQTAFVGQHNVENILVALGALSAFGAELPRAAAALAQIDPVPGRLERCDGPGDDVMALVDYAHTPDALERVLAALRPLLPEAAARLICVFGCGGGRDPGKRFPMGRAVARGADYAIVTSDNPRDEAPEAIAEPVADGLRAHGGHFEVCLDRAQAIERAVAMARPGDVVLVAGKGHETYQIVGGRSFPFDDREETQQALARRRQRRTEASGA